MKFMYFVEAYTVQTTHWGNTSVELNKTFVVLLNTEIWPKRVHPMEILP